MSFFRDAMKIPEQTPLPEEEQAVLDKVAKKVVEKSMTVPAIVFLESVKPLNFVGSQAMVFFEPIVQSLFNLKDYDTFRTALERRQTLEILIQKIEAMDAVAQARDKRIKAFFKEEKKKWKWYQRYLGVFQPRVTIPEDVLNGPVAPKADSKQD
jgi:hypothetical protein